LDKKDANAQNAHTNKATNLDTVQVDQRCMYNYKLID